MNITTTVARAYRAEMIKLRRPSTLAAMGVIGALSVLATVLAYALAHATPDLTVTARGSGFQVMLAQLAAPAGPTLGFVGGTTFIGLLVFVVFTVSMTNEYGQGTLRTLFLREPRRLGWLGGRLGAMFSALAAALLVALMLSVATALLMSQIRGIDTSQWWTGAALREAADNYLNALVGTVFFALVGTTLGILLRSTTLALAIGIAWMFPVEHIVQNAWSGATGVFPGLVFDAVGRGGVVDASYGSALAVGTGYALIAAVLGAVSLARRDVTA
ncbi:ABC transporter [Frankia sp. Cas3]|uniref:ABC transporter n=1 Tax=Frankia sp. Cas3 TaxID=3073926 RepID=UPI002AD1E3F0|nr:ABC transporter [Frankia sp. Cas3]